MEPVYGPGSGYETLLSTQNRCYSQDDIFGTFKTTSLVISRRHLCNVPHGIFGTLKTASLVLSRRHLCYVPHGIFGTLKTTSLIQVSFYASVLCEGTRRWVASFSGRRTAQRTPSPSAPTQPAPSWRGQRSATTRHRFQSRFLSF